MPKSRNRSSVFHFRVGWVGLIDPSKTHSIYYTIQLSQKKIPSTELILVHIRIYIILEY